MCLCRRSLDFTDIQLYATVSADALLVESDVGASQLADVLLQCCGLMMFGSCNRSDLMCSQFTGFSLTCFDLVGLGLELKNIFLWWQLHVCGVSVWVSVSFCVQSEVDDGPCFRLQ